MHYHWQDPFSDAEQEKLISWVSHTQTATEKLVGTLPFAVHLYFHRVTNAKEPVPWAHTQRAPTQGVHFYVDPDFELQAFINDWTAPHELSHLILPYLGERNAWFAEGFASYMQYQIMMEMGVLTANQSHLRYLERITRAQDRFDLPHLPFAQAAVELRKQGRYPTFYWGGAVYFWQVKTALAVNKDQTLIDTLTQFVQCCRRSSRGVQQLVDQLDAISGTNHFNAALKTFQTQPGFPEFSASMLDHSQ